MSIMEEFIETVKKIHYKDVEVKEEWNFSEVVIETYTFHDIKLVRDFRIDEVYYLNGVQIDCISGGIIRDILKQKLLLKKSNLKDDTIKEATDMLKLILGEL